MGIPSYYKTLCDTVPGLVLKKLPERPSHFWIDFNCMIYHCIRRPGATLYAGDDTRLQWENETIEAVCKYVKDLVKIVQPTIQVYIGVDGVVPMAKIRQQRLRRFKSYWTADEEVRIGIRQAYEPRWDTNAITPGTEFMERLGKRLHMMSGQDVKWIISTADEPGEGEHKLIHELRKTQTENTHVIYGLDADLIVLGLLQSREKIWLFREAADSKPTPSQQLGNKACGDMGEKEYTFFSIDKLRSYMFQEQNDPSYELDYCMGMSLLGNDFLPHSMSVKLKEGGHDLLLHMLLDVRSKLKMPLFSNNSWNKEALQSCFAYLAYNEEESIQESVSQKIKQRHQRTRGTTSKEHAQDEWNKTPLRLCDDLALMETPTTLKADWKRIYYGRYLNIHSQTDIDNLCYEYCKGLIWIGKYYMGESVNLSWHFAWFLPPLWSDLSSWLIKNPLPSSPINGILLKPQEQLALVLPFQSFWLVRDPKLRQIPKHLPQYFPKSFELFTAGHKQMWECEAMIPILTPERLRHVINSTS